MIVIIDYNVGNLDSLKRALDRIGLDVVVSSDPIVIQNATTIILPGVGAFKDAMVELERRGFDDIIKEHVLRGKMLIGICLGMQLLFNSSTEFGYKKGLGLIEGTCEYLEIDQKVPHMGWNQLEFHMNDSILKNIKDGDYVYFVHSYYVKTNKQNVIAYANYDVDIPAIVRNGNVIGMQFHPEKSGLVGERLLQTLKELIS